MHLPIWIWVAAGLAALVWGWRQYRGWQVAGEASQLQGEEQRALRAIHAQLLGQQSWHHLWSTMAARGIPVSLDGQAGTFKLSLLTLFTDQGHAYSESDPAIRGIRAWVQNGERKMVASLSFATGDVDIRDVKFLEWPG